MKKIILLLTISLFCFSGLFAQSWDDITVYWTVENGCDCNGSIDSTFQIVMDIYDVANNNYHVKDGDENWESGATNFSDFDVDDVKAYCESEEYENIPSFNIYYIVTMYCENTSQIFECDGRESVTGKTCYNFANGQVTLTTVSVEP